MCKILLHQEQTALWLEVTVIHLRCATSSNNQIPFLPIPTEIASERTPPPVSCAAWV